MDRDELAALGTAARRAQRLRDAAYASLADAVREALAAGMPEAEAARVAGVDRMTVRRWRRAGETRARNLP